MIDPRPLWDFDDPASSGERFLDAAEQADEPDAHRLADAVRPRARPPGEVHEATRVLDALASERPGGGDVPPRSSAAACCGPRAMPDEARPAVRGRRPRARAAGVSRPSTSTRCTWWRSSPRPRSSSR